MVFERFWKRSKPAVKYAVSSNDVRWAYNAILGREPESDAVVESICRDHRDWKQLVQTFLQFQEYPGGGMTLDQPKASGTNSAPVTPDHGPSTWPSALVESFWGPDGLNQSSLAWLPEAVYPNGWASHLELLCLYNLALYSPAAILEIGPWIGRSTTAICSGLRDRRQPRPNFDTIDFGLIGTNQFIRVFGPLPSGEEGVRISRPLQQHGGSLAVLMEGLHRNGLLDFVTSVIRGDFLNTPLARKYSFVFCDTTHDLDEAKRYVPKIATLLNRGAVVVFDDVLTEDFAEFICSMLPPSKRVLLHRYDPYSKYLVVKITD